MGKKLDCKKGASTIVITIVLIALTMAIGAAVWGIVSNMTKKQMDTTEACFGVFDKVKINGLYTCYDSANKKARFSIETGDIDVDSVIVTIASLGETKTYTILNDTNTISGVTLYPLGSPSLRLQKNGALTYEATGFPASPDLIKIAPKVKGKQCEASDSLSEIEDCELMA